MQPSYQTPNAQPVAPQPAVVNPGKTLGIISLVTSLINLGLIGLITGIIGLKKSKAAGFSNGLAKAGIIISIIGIVLNAIVFAIVIPLMISQISKLADTCKQLGPGTHQVGSATYTCN